MGLLWAGTVYAFGIGDILKYIGINDAIVDSDSSNMIVVTSPPIIPKYNLDKLLPTANRIILPTDYDPRTAGQCVGYVKYITGVEYGGNAIDWKQYINTDKPEVGSIVVMQVSRWGHLGIVIEIKGDKIVMRSRNWEGLWKITDNEFQLSDSRILGYIKY